ncbi:MAG: hypothetical protein RLZZ336_1562 [Cyanobacteriota bacterium]
MNVGDQQSQPPAQRPASERAGERFALYEREALERLRAGAELTQPASFLPLPLRLSALVLTGIAIAAVLWSLLARVPVQVKGVAVILPTSRINSLTAETDGTLYFQISGLAPDTLPLAQRQANALLGRYWVEEASELTTSVQDRSRLQQLILAALMPLASEPLVLAGSAELGFHVDDAQALGNKGLWFAPGTMLAAIDSPAAHLKLNSALLNALPNDRMQRDSADEAMRRAKDLAAITGLQRQQQQQIQSELQARQKLFARYQKLNQQGAVNEVALLDESGRINSLRNQLLTSRRDLLNTHISSKEQLVMSRRAAAASDQTRNTLEDQLIAYLAATRLVAPEQGLYLLSSTFKNGSLVKKGDEVFSYTTRPPALSAEVPVFLAGVNAQQVDEGMSVLLTPRGISRAQYGGIPGVVSEVTRLPLPVDGVIGVLGSRSLAQAVQAALPAPYLVRVKLEQAEPRYCRQELSRRCFRWSSGRLPPHPVRLATLADVQITTTHRRPIEFVMPALRRFLGLVVDNR